MAPEAPTTLDPLFVELYPRLQALAGALLRGERVGHTLATSALVNEAYLRLRESPTFRVRTAGELYGAIARVMRYILVDHARARGAGKRGGGRQRVGLESEPAISEEGHMHLDVVETVHRLLGELAATGPLGQRQARVFELRAFAGLDVPVVAEALGVSVRLVFDDWAFALAWLLRRMGDV
jgi:RNA polymerase sigma factor (TIGR02999 family)